MLRAEALKNGGNPLAPQRLRDGIFKTVAVKIENFRSLFLEADKTLPLVGKNGGGQPGVGHRIIHRFAHQFVILDQTVIGIFRESQGREVEGVDNRFGQQLKVGELGFEQRQVVAEQIVAQDELRASGEPVEFGECVFKIETALPFKRMPMTGRADTEDLPVRSGFEVHAKRFR